MNSDSTGSMLVPWMSPGVNSPLRRFTAKTSTQRVYDVHSPRRVKNEKQSGAERQTVQEPLRILPEAISPSTVCGVPKSLLKAFDTAFAIKAEVCDPRAYRRRRHGFRV